MFYYLYHLRDVFSPLRVFQYITVRTVCAAGTAFLVSVLLGPPVIRALRRLRLGQPIREGGGTAHPKHGHKQGTPTMGGVLIVLSVCLSCLCWGRLSSFYLQLTVCSTVFMGVTGFWDDYRKILKKDSGGLSGRTKIGLQLLWTLALFLCLAFHPDTGPRLRHFMVPFLKEPLIMDMGAVAAFSFAAVVLIGATNAVNLTDGLDGLAIGCSSSVALSYLVMTYAAGHAVFADYLMIPYVRGAGELTVFCGALAGSCLGFLWYNCHPASVFMGDTGSLALGGGIAAVALIVKQELVLVIVGGVFVMEAVSVILQVLSFKTRGKRIFAMAPIHHHFEEKGWSETQVTIRFWILSIICALLGLLTLKVR